MERQLSDFKPGESGVVVRVAGEGKLRRRLFDMGVTPGARITLCRVAPLGDPVELTVRGYALSVRRSEALAVTMNAPESHGGQSV